MGPIEKELREVDLRSEDLIGWSLGAMRGLYGAAESLGVSLFTPELWPDIWSEAIEAAEALGL